MIRSYLIRIQAVDSDGFGVRPSFLVSAKSREEAVELAKKQARERGYEVVAVAHARTCPVDKGAR